MFHGAQGSNDVTFLFITDKPFNVHYTHVEDAPSEHNTVKSVD